MSLRASVVFLAACVAAVLLLGKLTPAVWSPYIAGALIGVVACLSMLLSGKTLGTSTTYLRLSGFVLKLLSPRAVKENECYRSHGVQVDWQMMLVIGILVGSMLSALGGIGIQWLWMPAMWAASFGQTVGLRLVVAFIGGILIGFGARWADGCTSGHGVAQAMQLSVAGWLSAICFFIAGVAVAFIMYGTGGGGL